jgi:hypothetical protein
VLGVVLQVLLGWPWWLVAAGVVVVVWLLFLSSAFWGGSPGRPLATEALLVVDPAPEQVELERVADVEPYVEGTERLEEASPQPGRPP